MESLDGGVGEAYGEDRALPGLLGQAPQLVDLRRAQDRPVAQGLRGTRRPVTTGGAGRGRAGVTDPGVGEDAARCAAALVEVEVGTPLLSVQVMPPWSPR